MSVADFKHVYEERTKRNGPLSEDRRPYSEFTLVKGEILWAGQEWLLKSAYLTMPYFFTLRSGSFG